MNRPILLLAMLIQSIAIHAQTDSTLTAKRALELADSLATANNYKLALSYADSAIVKATAQQDTALFVSGAFAKGRYLETLQRTADAIAEFERILPFVEKPSLRYLKLNTLEELIRLSESTQDFPRALEYTRQLHALEMELKELEMAEMATANELVYNGTIESMSKWQEARNRETDERIFMLSIAAAVAGLAVVLLLVMLILKGRQAEKNSAGNAQLQSDREQEVLVRTAIETDLEKAKAELKKKQKEGESLSQLLRRIEKEAGTQRADLEKKVSQSIQSARKEVEEIARTAPSGVSVEHILQLKNTLTRALGELRSGTAPLGMHPEDRSNLSAQLNTLCEALARPDLPIHFETFGAVRLTTDALNEQVYRIATELLMNGLVHSSASRLKAALTYSTDQISLVVQDNGKGITREQASSGAGLTAVRMRGQLINAHIDVATSPTEGTTYTITIPVR
ncbi:MAG: sensor histidine kinase [Flavobacteriales bacterium]|jgi:two-component system sensor histidine kinase UhpB